MKSKKRAGKIIGKSRFDNCDDSYGSEGEELEELGGTFVSAAPLYKKEDAFSGSRKALKTARNRIDGLLNGSSRDSRFYAEIEEAENALKEAIRHRKEYERLQEISKSEAWRYQGNGDRY